MDDRLGSARDGPHRDARSNAPRRRGRRPAILGVVSRVDQFESVFKAAAKTPYRHDSVSLAAVLVLTDLEAEQAKAFEQRVRAFLRTLEGEPAEPTRPRLSWTCLGREREGGIDALLELIRRRQPDLICTYRSLHTQDWRWSYTLGR